MTLTVRDNDGGEDSRSRQARPQAPAVNEAPEADFEVQCENLTCSFTDRSDDADGNLVNWEWDFGDAKGSSSRNPTHSYGAAGNYTVTLTVRDNDGAEDSRSREARARSTPPTPPSPPTGRLRPTSRCTVAD